MTRVRLVEMTRVRLVEMTRVRLVEMTRVRLVEMTRVCLIAKMRKRLGQAVDQATVTRFSFFLLKLYLLAGRDYNSRFGHIICDLDSPLQSENFQHV